MPHEYGYAFIDVLCAVIITKCNVRRSRNDDGDSIRGSFGFANPPKNVDLKNVYGSIKSLVYYTLNMAIHVPSRT